MSDGERVPAMNGPYGLGLNSSAWERRNRQLLSWETSETNREPPYRSHKRRSSKVKFSLEVMFMAAVSARDEKEVERILSEEEADVNCQNNDGLTAAHQVCAYMWLCTYMLHSHGLHSFYGYGELIGATQPIISLC